jgi:hypothetical protein
MKSKFLVLFRILSHFADGASGSSEAPLCTPLSLCYRLLAHAIVFLAHAIALLSLCYRLQAHAIALLSLCYRFLRFAVALLSLSALCCRGAAYYTVANRT